MNNVFAGNSLALPGAFGNSGLGMAGGTGLASHAAQMSFATANTHQHGGHNGIVEQNRGGNKSRIREVWASNLDEEMALLRAVADQYPHVSLVSCVLEAAQGQRLTEHRTSNFLDSSLDLWETLPESSITTINVYDVT